MMYWVNPIGGCPPAVLKKMPGVSASTGTAGGLSSFAVHVPAWNPCPAVSFCGSMMSPVSATAGTAKTAVNAITAIAIKKRLAIKSLLVERNASPA